jgi:hypothetical protein
MYSTKEEWLMAKNKKVVLFGMSGLGKTHISNMLRHSGEWYHYSIDYRIGTRYMGEYIEDSYKEDAMKSPYLRELLLGDSIHISSNISFNNLAPLSNYLGKPGNKEKGGLSINEYKKRQAEHHIAEVKALLDTPNFIDKSNRIYDYPNFVCDTGGSICEVVNPENPNDPVLTTLAENTLIVWIQGSEHHTDELIKRFNQNPKPMCYNPNFLDLKWKEYLKLNKCSFEEVDPDDFVRWTYSEAMEHRNPIYKSMSSWGITVQADLISKVKTPEEFNLLIGSTLSDDIKK